MQRSLTLLGCIFLLVSNLNAQDLFPEIPNAATPETAVQASDLEDMIDSSSDVIKTPVEDIAPADSAATTPAETESSEPVDEENAIAEVEGTIDVDEAMDEGTEGAGAETSEAIDSEGDEVDLDDEEGEEDGPIFVSLNNEGQLVGLATATVGGEMVPVEANVSLVRDGVLLAKIVSDEDGAFAFPNIAPGDYNMYGSASSYCGQQPFTVMSSGNTCGRCRDGVSLELVQGRDCYSGFSGAPAASFSSGGVVGGSGGGGFFGGGGGGFAGGGGGAAVSRSGLRLLGIGGIATAIALGSSGDGDASPSE